MKAFRNFKAFACKSVVCFLFLTVFACKKRNTQIDTNELVKKDSTPNALQAYTVSTDTVLNTRLNLSLADLQSSGFNTLYIASDDKGLNIAFSEAFASVSSHISYLFGYTEKEMSHIEGSVIHSKERIGVHDSSASERQLSMSPVPISQIDELAKEKGAVLTVEPQSTHTPNAIAESDIVHVPFFINEAPNLNASLSIHAPEVPIEHSLEDFQQQVFDQLGDLHFKEKKSAEDIKQEKELVILTHGLTALEEDLVNAKRLNLKDPVIAKKCRSFFEEIKKTSIYTQNTSNKKIIDEAINQRFGDPYDGNGFYLLDVLEALALNTHEKQMLASIRNAILTPLQDSRLAYIRETLESMQSNSSLKISNSNRSSPSSNIPAGQSQVVINTKRNEIVSATEMDEIIANRTSLPPQAEWLDERFNKYYKPSYIRYKQQKILLKQMKQIAIKNETIINDIKGKVTWEGNTPHLDSAEIDKFLNLFPTNISDEIRKRMSSSQGSNVWEWQDFILGSPYW